MPDGYNPQNCLLKAAVEGEPKKSAIHETAFPDIRIQRKVF